MKTTSVLRLAWLFSLLLFLLSGCSGDSHSEPREPQIISGRAAAGAPLLGTVTVKDSSRPVRKERLVAIAADGSYSVDVNGMTGPFVLRADGRVGGRYYQLCSAATPIDVGGTINITPFTDLIVANIAGDTAANYYASGAFSTLSVAELGAAEAELQHKLQPLFTAAGLPVDIDLLHTPFTADHTGLDSVLDIVRVTVDSATALAEIRNLIGNTAITDDLRSRNDASAFTDQDAVRVAAGLTDMQLILAGFDRFAALFATTLPSATNPELLALFDQANFLDDGAGLDLFLSALTADPALIGVRFADVTAITLDPVAGSGEVGFILLQPVPTRKVEMVRFKMVRSGGVWLMQGNQRIAHARLRAQTDYNTIQYSNDFTMSAGLDPEVRDARGRGIDYAVVKGPGLPTEGVVLENNLAFDHFTMPSYPGSDFIYMRSTTVAALPETDVAYTIELWENNDTAITIDDTLLATYTETLAKRPFMPKDPYSVYPSELIPLIPGFFPALTAEGLAAWRAFSWFGGTLTVSWTLPAGQQSDLLSVDIYAGGPNAHVKVPLAPAQTVATQTITLNPGTGTLGATRTLIISAVDRFGRLQRRVYQIVEP